MKASNKANYQLN